MEPKPGLFTYVVVLGFVFFPVWMILGAFLWQSFH